MRVRESLEEMDGDRLVVVFFVALLCFRKYSAAAGKWDRIICYNHEEECVHFLYLHNESYSKKTA